MSWNTRVLNFTYICKIINTQEKSYSSTQSLFIFSKVTELGKAYYDICNHNQIMQ